MPGSERAVGPGAAGARGRRSRRGEHSVDPSGAFRPVRVVRTTGSGGEDLGGGGPGVVVEVLLRSGRVLRAGSNVDPVVLARLAEALEGRPC